MRSQPVILSLATLVLLAQAVPAEGQVRDRLKRAAAGKAVSAVAERALGGSAETPGATRTPRFDDLVVEITPALLDRFAAGLAAEEEARRDLPRLRASLPDPVVQERCRAGLERDRAYQQLARKAEDSESADDELRDLLFERCGEDEGSLSERPERMGRQAVGVTSRQYSVLKERVIPFCNNPGRTGAFVYTRAEADALGPRCDSLLPALRANT
jgi:hypothetical protein